MMTDIMDKLASIREDFSLFTDPRDKYVYLVDLAKESTGLNPNELIDANNRPGLSEKKPVTHLHSVPILMP